METSEGEACRDWRSPPRSPSAITGSGLADGVDDSRSGQAALSEAEYDLATQFLTRAIRSGELSLEVLAHAFYDRGIAYGEMAEYDRALEDYTTAIGLAPDFAAAYNNRGVIHGRKGAYESAIADYSAAIRLAPDDVTAHENRARAYARTGAGTEVEVASGDSVPATTAVVEELVAATSTESFTWVDGKKYRYLSSEFLCDEDGSLVVWQRANAAGKFGPVRATAQNCGSR